MLHNFQKYDIVDPTVTATTIAHVYTEDYLHPNPTPLAGASVTALAVANNALQQVLDDNTAGIVAANAACLSAYGSSMGSPATAADEDSADPAAVEDDQAEPEPEVVNELPEPKFIESPPARTIAEEHLKVLRHFHSLNRHQGVTRTLQAIKKAGHYWPTMRLDTVHFVQTCPICQLTWRIPRAAHIHLDTFESYDPFYYLTMDFMGPYPADSQGNCHYLCIIDTFTRYVEIFATPDETARTASLCLLAIYSRYTLPRIIGPAFIDQMETAGWRVGALSGRPTIIQFERVVRFEACFALGFVSVDVGDERVRFGVR